MRFLDRAQQYSTLKSDARYKGRQILAELNAARRRRDSATAAQKQDEFDRLIEKHQAELQQFNPASVTPMAPETSMMIPPGKAFLGDSEY